jgi:2,4-dienoyl-CoA reductase-like NADH-dependent reductase (Old Yellow Enzyme family)
MTTNPWPHLNSVFSIRDLELRNRLVFQPHFTALAHDGQPSEDHLAYYEERAAGGVGLVIFEGQSVMPMGVFRRTLWTRPRRRMCPCTRQSSWQCIFMVPGFSAS